MKLAVWLFVALFFSHYTWAQKVFISGAVDVPYKDYDSSTSFNRAASAPDLIFVVFKNKKELHRESGSDNSYKGSFSTDCMQFTEKDSLYITVLDNDEGKSNVINALNSNDFIVQFAVCGKDLLEKGKLSMEVESSKLTIELKTYYTYSVRLLSYSLRDKAASKEAYKALKKGVKADCTISFSTQTYTGVLVADKAGSIGEQQQAIERETYSVWKASFRLLNPETNQPLEDVQIPLLELKSTQVNIAGKHGDFVFEVLKR